MAAPLSALPPPPVAHDARTALIASGRKNVVRIHDAWYVACASRELGKKKPLARTILDTPLALFRGRDGTVGALLDRCPHRNVPLSIGTVAEGELKCRYHGWRFDCEGKVKAIPGLPVLQESEINMPGRSCLAFPVVERHGYVFVWMNPEVAPHTQPFDLVQTTWRSHLTLRLVADCQGTLHSTLENILDVPHTSFLHGGLFRTEEKKNEITAVVRRTRANIETEFIGEPRPPGLFGRALSPSGGTVEHFDRFFLPSVAQVEYRLGPENNIVATTLCTPVSETCTRMFVTVSVKTQPLAYLLAPLVLPAALSILRQDKWILKAQTEVVDRFGTETFSSTSIDLMGPHILHLLKKAEANKLDEAIVREETFRLRT